MFLFRSDKPNRHDCCSVVDNSTASVIDLILFPFSLFPDSRPPSLTSDPGGMPMTLKSKFDTGEFAILAEMEPPKGADVSAFTGQCQGVKRSGGCLCGAGNEQCRHAHQFAGRRMILQNEGLETVLQVCCRDRNRLALQADLLGGQCPAGSRMSWRSAARSPVSATTIRRGPSMTSI